MKPFTKPRLLCLLKFVKRVKNLFCFKCAICRFIDDFEISVSAEQLLEFIEETTKFRESFKFEFTKNLSLALELLAEVGEELGFDREMLSHISIESIKGLSPSSGISEIVKSFRYS